MTIAQQLIDVNQAKQDIKTAIEAKGVSMTGVTFPDYHTKIAQIASGGGTWTPDDVKTWDRPTHWPTVTAPGVNEIVILQRIDQMDELNRFNMAVVFSGSTSFYVDWGDGTTQQYTTQFGLGGQFGHITKTFDWTTHPGLPEPESGYKVSTIRIYGADAIDNIIAVYPHHDYNNQAGYTVQEYRSKFLEFHINAPSLETIEFYSPSYGNGRHPFLEYVNIIQWGPAPSIQELFAYACPQLQRVDLPTTAIGNTAANSKCQPFRMFYNCHSLIEINGFNMSSLDGSISAMFQNCYSLQFIPFDIDFTQFTYSQNIFNNMRSLLEIQSGINIDVSNHGSYQTDWNAYFIAEDEYFQGIRTEYPDPNDPEFLVFVAQTLDSLFYNCYSLQIVNPTITFADTITSFSYIFYFCYALLQVPTFFASGTNTEIGGGSALQLNQTFYGCSSLKEIPADFVNKPFNNITSFNSMFYSCHSLQEINWSWSYSPTASVTMQQTFKECYNLYKLPDIDTSMVSGWYETFYQCYVIKDFGPSWSLESTTNYYPNFQRAFYQCHNMTHMPGNGDLGNATTHGSNANYGVNNAEQCFYQCYSLQRFGTMYPRTQYYNVPNCQNMFAQCDSLVEIGEIDLSHMTGANNTYNYSNLNLDYMGSLSYANIYYSAMNGYTGYYSIFLRNNNLSATALNTIFNNLGTRTVGTKRIYIAQNPGTATCNTTIATNKGWTVYT